MGHSINLLCASFNRVDGAHVHHDALESMWKKVKDFMGSPERQSERETPAWGRWGRSGCWQRWLSSHKLVVQPIPGFWQRPGGSWWVWYEEGAFQSSSQADRWLLLLLSALRQCTGPEQQDAPWLACLINWSEWWENERTTQGSHFPCWTLLLLRLHSTFLQV